MRRHFVFAALVCLLSGCNQSSSLDEYSTSPLKLPNGTVIRVETMMRKEDMMRGMMFRESLPQGRGMLFIHGSPGLYPYWMHQVKVPLDMIWMEPDGKVFFISANTPPCQADPCPMYGPDSPATIVLEIAGGMAAKEGVTVGSQIRVQR